MRSDHGVKMHSRNEKRGTWESFDPVVWPESSVEVDDEAFARAIAEGRRSRSAA